MAMGKAVVTTDVGSVTQYIEDGISGFIVPAMDSKALAAKVEELINNQTLRKEMGANAQSVAKKYLDVSIAAEKYAMFYETILNQNK